MWVHNDQYRSWGPIPDTGIACVQGQQRPRRHGTRLSEETGRNADTVGVTGDHVGQQPGNRFAIEITRGKYES